MLAALEQPVFYLGREVPGVLDVAVLDDPDERVLPLFTSRQRAEAHLAALPEGAVDEVAADDYRAKEDLLRAAAAQGATGVVFDLENASRVPLARALAYILSFKREVACL